MKHNKLTINTFSRFWSDFHLLTRQPKQPNKSSVEKLWDKTINESLKLKAYKNINKSIKVSCYEYLKEQLNNY